MNKWRQSESVNTVMDIDISHTKDQYVRSIFPDRYKLVAAFRYYYGMRVFASTVARMVDGVISHLALVHFAFVTFVCLRISCIRVVTVPMFVWFPRNSNSRCSMFDGSRTGLKPSYNVRCSLVDVPGVSLGQAHEFQLLLNKYINVIASIL
jgi:hypothetical protein